MIKKLLLTLTLVTFGISCAAEEGAAGKTFVEGTHYDVLVPPVRTLDQDTIEVAEYFAHGCGHCYMFEPLLEQWRKTKPEDVSFRGVPVVFRATGELHARAYFAAKALGVLDTMNTVIFQAIHVDRKQLSSEEQIAALFAAHGVSEADFTKAFNSFGVKAQLDQSMALTKSAGIHATPTLVVNGKYRVSAGKGGHPEMLEVTNFLVEKERVAKGG